MAVVNEYTHEQLNYFRICYVTTDILAEGLREIFKQEWDKLYKSTKGEWKDERHNGMEFYNAESPRNQKRNAQLLATMQNGNRGEWDCTMLFYAILFSDCVGSRLSAIIRKNVDDLRNFRNEEFAHLPPSGLSERDFQNTICKVDVAFQALSLPTVKIQDLKYKKTFPKKDLKKVLKEVDNLKQEVQEKESQRQVLEDQLQNVAPSFCVLPPKPSHEISGRESEVAKIVQRLRELNESSDNQLSHLYISGNPGSGKSQLAGLVAKRFFDDLKEMPGGSSFVMTVNAASLDSLLESYASFARHLKCPDYSIMETLGSKDLTMDEKITSLKMLVAVKIPFYTSWLLVVDNVTTMSSVHVHLPQFEKEAWAKGQLLITTQDTTSIPSESSFVNHISASKGMEPNDACSLLSKLSGIPASEMVGTVAQRLDYQPLALASAAVFVREIWQDKVSTHFGWEEYLKILEKGKRQEREDTVVNSSPMYPNSMTKPIKLAVEALMRSDKFHKHLFTFVALCAPQPLNVDIAVKYIVNVHEEFDEADKELIQKRLKRSSLLLFQDDEGSCFIQLHQFVHDAIKTVTKECPESQTEEVISGVITSFNEFIGMIPLENKRLNTRHITPHLKALAMVTDKVFLRDNFFQVHDKGIFEKCKNLGNICKMHCEFKGAKTYFEYSLTFKLQELGLEHVDVATSYNDLAWIYMELGDFEQAKEYEECALEIKLDKLDPEHADVAASYNTLAVIYKNLGDFEQAREYQERDLVIKLNKLGPKHVDVARSYNNFAKIYVELGDFQQAKEYQEHALVIFLERLGPAHVDVARSYMNLFSIYHDLGDFKKARQYQQRALAIGADKHSHNNTPNTITHEAETHLSQSKKEDDDDEDDDEGSSKNDKRAERDTHNVGQKKQQKAKKGSDTDSGVSSEGDGYMDSQEEDHTSDSSASLDGSWSGHQLNVVRSFRNAFCHCSGECQGVCTQDVQDYVMSALDDTTVHKTNFVSLLQFVKWKSLNHWSNCQPEFVVLNYSDSEDFNTINCLDILSFCAFTKGDTNMLEEIEAIAIQSKHRCGSGFVLNKLGVMFSEKVLYEKSKKCLDMAKSYFHSHQDNLREAVATLNQAVLHKALGDYEIAQSLCSEAASLCHGIDHHLAVKVLGRVADMLEEFGNYDRFRKTLEVGVELDIAGASKAISDILIEVMKIQLKEASENLAAEESKDFVCRLFTFLDNPDKELMNAEVVRAFMIAAKIHRKTGHDDEACDLLKKLQTTFLLALGEEHSLNGSLLYQIGCFFIDCEKVDEALSVLKQAEEILMHSFGKEHHAVSACTSMLGSCFLFKGNNKEAMKLLNEALATFRTLNPNHPEVGGILLKLSFIHVKEENFQLAQYTMEEALKVLILAVGKVSPKTATAYFQSAMFLLKDKALWSLAEERMMTAIDIYLRLGLKPTNSCVIACHSLVGVLQLALKKTEEAEKSLQNVEFDWSTEPWIKTSILLASSVGLLVPSPTVGLNRSFSLCAKVVSLVNLVHMKTGDERLQHLVTLVSCLEKHKTEELQVLDFAGQAIFYNTCKLPLSEKSVAVILSLGPQLTSSQYTEVLNSPSDFDQNRCDLFLSSVKKKHHCLFLRIPHNNIQGNMSFLGSVLHRCVLTLWSQPSFRKDHVEGIIDVHRKLTLPINDIPSLCRLIDCLPLLVELELSELQEQHDNFDYLNSWESSGKSVKPSVHVSYFSSECSLQREAEFVFDHLNQRLEEKLVVNKGNGVVTCDVSPTLDVASFALEKPGKSCVSISVENNFVIVKCCSFKESVLEFLCSSIQEALEKTVQSLCFRVNIEQSSWLPDSYLERCGGVKESVRKIHSLDETSPLTFLCADSRDPESGLKRQPTVNGLQDGELEISPLFRQPCSKLPTDMDVCLSLLEYLLSQTRREATKEVALESCNVPSEQSSVAENHSICSESDRSISPQESLTDSSSSVKSTKELDPHLSLDVSDLEAANNRHMPNCEERIVQSSPDQDTKEPEQLKSATTESLYVGREEAATRQVYINTGPFEPGESILIPSSAASSRGNGVESVSGDFENVLTASRKEFFELQLEMRQLKEQLKQSEEEKQELSVELGKFLFLEDKGKRRGRLLGGAASLHDSGFSLHSRLLEISDLLSSQEVKKIKFLVKGKVSGFKLVRITEAFELFEELETNGVFPCDYIANLLVEIQRYDLVEKLGMQLPFTAAKRGSDILSGQGLSTRENRSSGHVENSSNLTPVQDYSLDVQLKRRERRHIVGDGVFTRLSIRGDSMQLQGVEENDKSLITEEAEIKQDTSKNSSLALSESSRETNTYTAVSSESEKSSNSSMKSALSTEEFHQFPTLTSGGYLSNSNDKSLLSSSFEETAMVADPSFTLLSPCDTTDGSPILMTLSSKACRSEEISGDTDPYVGIAKEQTKRSPKFYYADVECDGSPILASCQSYSAYSCSENIECYVADGEDELFDKATEKSEWKEIEGEKEIVNSCDGARKTVHSSTSAHTRTDSSDSFVGEIVGTQSSANGGNLPLTQQGTSSTAEKVLRTQSSAARDWEHLGARPKEAQRSDVQPKPTEPVLYITDGLAGDFLARHTQDKSLHDSIYQTDDGSLFNDIPSQGTSFIDGDISQSSRAQPYFGDCHVTSGTEPFGGTGHSLVSGSNRPLGSPYVEPFSGNSGLWSSHLGNDSSSLYSNHLSRNTSTAANNYSFQSDLGHGSHRFAGVDLFDGQTYLPSAQQTPYPPIASDPVLNSYPGMTGSSFADPSRTGAALTLPGDPVYNAPRFNNFSSEQLTGPAHDTNRFAGDDDASAFISNQGTDEPAQKPNLALGNSNTTRNIDDEANSPAQYQLGNSTFDGIFAARSTHDTSVLEPRLGDTDNNSISVLNNRDFGTDSVEASDNSLLALERRVAEACALVERVLREREEREQFGREIERKEQLIREQRARERREREERELREAENWPQQQEAINARSQWLCEHYQRHCRVRFPCCTQFYPCHRCHNISKACDNEEAKACHATHLKCSHCQHEQEIGEDSAKCRKCGGKMSAYFCPICKHFTSVDKNPYHCKKCGICRIHQDKSFHCEVCNVCLDKRLEGNHKCRPDSGHDECCICLEDAFSGCQILPCSHKVHRECAIAMIQNGIRTCPICRHPLYSQSRE